MSTNKVKKIVKAFAEVLKKHQFDFKKIYVFGSYATGKIKEESDIDVAVVVDKAPKGRRFLDKEMLLWEFTTEADSRIEPVLLEEKDLNKKEGSILGYEILKHGILVATG